MKSNGWKILSSFLLLLVVLALQARADNETTIGGRRGAGHLIQDEATTLQQRPYLNFTGTGVTCADSGGKTVCTINTGSGTGGSVIAAKESGTQKMASFDTINFLTGFDVVENPSLTAQISLDLSESFTGAVTADSSNQTFLSLSSDNVTGTLADAKIAATIARDSEVTAATSTTVIGPASNTDSNFPQWDGANSKTLKDGMPLAKDLVPASPLEGGADNIILGADGDVGISINWITINDGLYTTADGVNWINKYVPDTSINWTNQVPLAETDSAHDTCAEISGCVAGALASGGTLTSTNVCQYDGAGIDCNLPQDGTGACASGSVCTGGHTHATTEISGVNAGTDLTADLEEEVTEGSLADSVIVSADVKDNTLTAGDMADSLDFGGDTSFEIPNGASPTVDAAGEIAVDTTDDQLLYYGGAERVITYKQQKCFALETPTTADTNITVFIPTDAITVTNIICNISGGTSASVKLTDGTNDLDTIACDQDAQTDDGSIANNTFNAAEPVKATVTAVTGTVPWVSECFTFTTTKE